MISLCPAASPKQFTNSSINSPALAMRLCQEMLSEQFWSRLYLHRMISLVISGALHLTNKTHKVTMMMLLAVAPRTCSSSCCEFDEPSKADSDLNGSLQT